MNILKNENGEAIEIRIDDIEFVSDETREILMQFLEDEIRKC